MPRFLFLLLPLLAACAAVPDPGERLFAEVTGTATPASVTDYNPALRNALAQGVTEAEVADGRFSMVACAARGPEGHVKHLYPVRLPPGLTRPDRDTHVVFRPGIEGHGRGPIGEVLRPVPAPPPAERVEARVNGFALETLVPCEGGVEPGLLRGRLYEPSNRYALRWLRQQDGWLAALPAQALAEGRIVTGVCTPSAREVRHFYLEAPPGMVLRRGDLVEAVAGASIGTGPSPVGRVLRRLEAPPPGAIVEYRPPRRMVACVPPR